MSVEPSFLCKSCKLLPGNPDFDVTHRLRKIVLGLDYTGSYHPQGTRQVRMRS
jgi:hypothetical protein